MSALREHGSASLAPQAVRELSVVDSSSAISLQCVQSQILRANTHLS